MALVYKDRVKALTTAHSGTGTFTMGSAASGYQAFSVIGDGNTCVYLAVGGAVATEWEIGIGTYTASGTTLARTTLLSSSTGSAVNFTSGTHTVSVIMDASRAIGAFHDDAGIVPGGRLTLESGMPVSTTDQTSKTNVYYTPHAHDRIALWTGAYWAPIQFTEYTLALGTLTSGKNYDVFAYLNSGAFAMELLAWTSDSARATAITVQDGRYCKSGDKTRLYLGTIRTTSTTTTEDSDTKRFVWNQYNQVDRRLRKVADSTTSWTYATATWQSARASTANRVEIVTGNPSLLDLALCVLIQCDRTEGGAVSIGEDSTSAPAADVISSAYFYLTQADVVNTQGDSSAVARLQKYPAVGYHYYQWIERVDAGTVLFFGDDATNGTYRPGLSGNIKG